MDTANNAVSIFYFIFHCFNHIQLARQFGSELDRCQIRLELIQKRLDRWSEISNRDASPLAVREITSGSRIISGDQERTTAEIICAIQETLHKARREAAKIKVDLAVQLNGDVCTAPDPKKMRGRITEFLHKRRVHTARAVGGMKWASYKRDQLDRFIADISALVADLEGLVNS